MKGNTMNAENQMTEQASMMDALLAGNMRILEECPAGIICTYGKQQKRLPVYIKITCSEEVNEEALLCAAREVQERFPYIRRGLARLGDTFYYVEGPLLPSLRPFEQGIRISGSENGFHAFEILTGRHMIVVTADHALLDGSSLMRVTDYLIYRYRVHTGRLPDGIFLDSSKRSEEEADLVFLPTERPSVFPVVPPMQSWHLPSGRKAFYDLIHLTVRTDEVLSVCRQLQTSPSALLLLLLAEAAGKLFPEAKASPFVISLPIDFRKILGIQSTLKDAAYTCYLDLNKKELKNIEFDGKAALLRKIIREHKDARYAGSWLLLHRFLLEKGFQSTGDKSGGSFTSMELSYIRPAQHLFCHHKSRDDCHSGPEGSGKQEKASVSRLYDGMALCFSIVSSPQDVICNMLEDGEGLQLFIRNAPEAFLSSVLQETFAKHGLNVCLSREPAIDISSEPPSLQVDALPPVIFFFVNASERNLAPLLPVMKRFIRKGCHVRVYSGEAARREIEAQGAVCISYDAFRDRGQRPQYAACGLLRMLELAEAMDYMAGRDIRTLRPAYTIIDTESIWGRLLAEKHGLSYVMSSADQVLNLFTIAEDRLDYFKALEPYETAIDRELKHLQRKGFPKKTLLSLLCPGNDVDIIAGIPEAQQKHLHTLNRERVFFMGCGGAAKAADWIILRQQENKHRRGSKP